MTSFSVRLMMVMALFFSRGALSNAQCPNATALSDACIKAVNPSDTCNYAVDIYEDCPSNTELFTIEGMSISACENTFVGNGATMVLDTSLDAETKQQYICSNAITGGDGTTHSVAFTVLDVDEYLPALHNQDPAETIYLLENNEVGAVLLNIRAGDDDYGETATMTAQVHSTVEGTFEIQQQGTCVDATCTEAEFSLIVTQSLDYETGVFYEIDVDFTTTDERGTSSSTTLKALLFLNDTSDTPPFFMQNIPSASFPESETTIDNIITLQARDRDTGVNHAICYFIASGNEDDHFALGETTGVLSCPNGIDREALSQTSFQLSLMAIEILDGDCASYAPQPNNVTQTTSLLVLDMNDNSPEFNETQLNIIMPELTSGDQLTSTTFEVTDLDEGAAGSYTLASDDPTHLGFDRDSGSGKSTFVIKALYVEGDNIFDYEKMTGGNYDLTFQVTATEVENPDHTSTMTVTITLDDVNDLEPVFDEENYSASVPENSVKGTSVISVQATDGDASADYGTPSLRYFLSQCTDYFTIDTETGEITVASDDALDYEQMAEIQCGLEVRDKTGQSPYLSGTAALSVVLEDVDDTPPILTVQGATVSEAAEVGSVVTGISVRDVDTQASVSFNVDYDSGTDAAVMSWFSFTPRNCTEEDLGNFCADLVVVAELDRETQGEVQMTIIATDDNTAVNDPSDSTGITITLSDVNDVAPSFCEDYATGLSVYENDVEGTEIASICASDPDIGDVLEFSCSDCTQVAIDSGSGLLSVVTPLDRETDSQISVTITVTDAANHSSSVVATIVVKDRNDNAPQLSEGFCETPYSVSEDAPNGTTIAVVNSTDIDEGAHADVLYSIVNAETGNPLSPFYVDPVSGVITVDLNPDVYLVLDREAQDYWTLQLQAFDSCEQNEAFCEPKVSWCLITVTVLDVNDNSPYLEPERKIYAGEELKKDEDVPDSVITAQDDDLPNSEATEIHYLVTELISVETGEIEEPAFEAVEFNETTAGIDVWSCRLRTLKDLTHMAGLYNLTIKATDGSLENPGNSADLTINLEITDANDYTPEIVMGSCPSEYGQEVIISEETYDDGDCIPCYDGGPLVEMTYTDSDTTIPNNLAVITVDYTNSTVYPLGEAGQLESFEIRRYTSEWRLCLKPNSANLSLESGQAYNLSLRVEDEGTPILFSYDWIFLNLTPVSEFNPNFGSNVSDCYYTTYILEETTDTGDFRAAEDEDNAGAIYDIIYYYIVGGDKSLFTIPEPTVPKVRPRDSLDRDDGPGNYTILIRATNSRETPPDVGDDVPTSTDMLQVTIVLMDQNDNAPVFNSDLFYGSVLQSGSPDQVAAIIVATDKDLNETLEYERISDLTWEPDENYGDDVFEVVDDSVIGTVWLRQDPSSLSGYCLFSARVNDRLKDEHQDTAFVQIFIVKADDEVAFRFRNDIATLQEAQEDIEMVLSVTFTYDAFVDSISPKGGSDNTTKDSVVLAHFVNSSQTVKAADVNPGNLVSPNIIESLASSASTSSQLQASMSQIGLELYQVGNAQLDGQSELETQLLTYQIVLGVVSLVLLSIVFLLLTAYCVRTRKLERRVKVLTTNTFGSQSSDLNKMDVAAAPNANLFKGEGTNPMFNISLQEFNKQDTGSLSSGDSVLVGVEDNPEFQDYKADQGRDAKTDAPAFVSPDGITSNNPLFSVQPSAPARSNDGSDAGSYADGDLGTPNPNFVFQ